MHPMQVEVSPKTIMRIAVRDFIAAILIVGTITAGWVSTRGEINALRTDMAAEQKQGVRLAESIVELTAAIAELRGEIRAGRVR